MKGGEIGGIGYVENGVCPEALSAAVPFPQYQVNQLPL